jgi:nucleoside-diphosphate-sugar epimerase
MGRRLLITGATGGLGLALVEAARTAGHEVVATGRSLAPRARIERAGAAFVAADLAEPRTDLRALVRGCDSVIHAAALSASWGPREAFDRVNVEATAALLAAARAEGCGRFVFVSSPSIFASFHDRLGIRADDAPARPPLNHYARTKLAAETLVLAANGPATRTSAIRPRAIVGPDDQVLLPRLADLARRRWMPMLRRGEALIELTDVRDAAEAILRAEADIERVAGRAVNVSGGHPRRVREVATALAAVLGHRPLLVDLPVALGHVLAWLSEGMARSTRRRSEPRLTRYSLATLAYSQTFDLAETAERIGFRPRRDGLAALLAAAEGWR